MLSVLRFPFFGQRSRTWLQRAHPWLKPDKTYQYVTRTWTKNQRMNMFILLLSFPYKVRHRKSPGFATLLLRCSYPTFFVPLSRRFVALWYVVVTLYYVLPRFTTFIYVYRRFTATFPPRYEKTPGNVPSIEISNSFCYVWSRCSHVRATFLYVS